MSEPPSYDPSGNPGQSGGQSGGQPGGQPGNQPPQYGAGQYGNPGGPGAPGAQPPQYGAGQFPSGPGNGNGNYGTWTGGNDANRGNSGIAIAALVTSLTCCLSWLGVILGFIGLGKTGQGKARGRWMAVTGIVVGSVLTLATVGLGIFVFVLADSIVTPDDAKAGQCINVDEDKDEKEVTLMEKDCSDDHDGEIGYAGSFGDAEDARSDLDPGDITLGTGEDAIARNVCSQLADEAYSSLGDEYKWDIASEDTSDPDPEDTFICYVQLANGDKLDKKLG